MTCSQCLQNIRALSMDTVQGLVFLKTTRRELKKLRLKSLFWALCLLGVIIYVFAVLFTSFGQQEFQIIPVQPATGLLGEEVLVGVFMKQILEVLHHPLKGIIEPNHTKK